MFKFATDETPSSKCHVSAGVLPRFIDPEQPPSKKKPFSTIMNQSFTHTVNLILPKEIYEIVQESVDSKFSEMKYSRVIMSLSEILEGEFFNQYIKTGNIMMLMPTGPSAMKLTALADVNGSNEGEKMSIAKFLSISYVLSPFICFAVVGSLKASTAAMSSLA